MNRNARRVNVRRMLAVEKEEKTTVRASVPESTCPNRHGDFLWTASTAAHRSLCDKVKIMRDKLGNVVPTLAVLANGLSVLILVPAFWARCALFTKVVVLYLSLRVLYKNTIRTKTAKWNELPCANPLDVCWTLSIRYGIPSYGPKLSYRAPAAARSQD